MKLKFLLILIIFSLSSLILPGQTSSPVSNDPFTNPVILSHYSIQELQDLQLNDPVKFTTISYYYTNSYIIQSVNCNECRKFDPASFDVSVFERFRLKSERFERTFTKYGFKLILLSIDELEYKTPVQLTK